MTSKKKLIFHALLLCIMNGIYYIWQYYPKHIFILAKGDTVIQDMITNVLYFFLYFIFLIYIVKPQGCPLSWKKYVGTFALLLAVQLVFDILKTFGNVFGFYSILANDICSILCLIVTWLVLVRSLSVKFHKPLNKHFRFVISGGLIVGFTFTVIILFNIRDIQELQTATQRLSDLSQLTQLARDKELCVQIRNMTLETVFSLYIISVFHQLTMDTENIKNGSSQQRNQFLASILLLFVGAMAVGGIKLLILPHTAIMKIESVSLTRDFTVPPTEFYLEKATTTIKRGTGYGKAEPVCSIESVYVYYANKKLLTFKKIHATSTSSSEFNTDESFGENHKKDLSIPGIEAYAYGNDFLMFVEDGKPKVVLIKDISRSKESDVLTKICEAMIEDGDWHYFENGYKYLEKYDPTFLQPYVKRYAEGDFTNEELVLNAHIYPAYIQQLAKSIE